MFLRAYTFFIKQINNMELVVPDAKNKNINFIQFEKSIKP